MKTRPPQAETPPDWQPQKGPQTLLLQSRVPDIFFGGARGGGKTDGLLGDFLDHADRYQEAAHGCVFRRSLTEFVELERRARELYYRRGTYNETEHAWTFHSGATFNLCYLEKDKDADRYLGWQNTWLGFDQLEQWPKADPVDKLWGTLRSAAGVPCVRRSTGNPGGRGHSWVKARYIDPHPHGLEPFTYQPQPELAPQLRLEAVFIPARLEDNAYLFNDPTYEARLAAAGSAALYRAWRYGDWDAIEGAVFDEWRRDLHVITYDLRIPRGWNWAGGLDWGYRAPGWFGLFAAGPEGDVICTQELYFKQETAERIGRAIGLLCRYFPVEYIAGDEQMWYQTGVSAPTIAEELQKGIADCYQRLEETPKLMEATHGRGSRVARCQLTHRYLSWQTLPDGKTIPPWGRPLLRFMARCKAAIRTIPALPPDEAHPEDVDTEAEDHPYDGLGAYLMSRPRLPEREYVPPVKDQHPGLTKRGTRAPPPPPPWERVARQAQMETPFEGFRVPRDLEPVD